mmetsp:Transcript_30192/g.78258  ORF Transcript_30192/g.78258 Transcript_30192/m.78258 type:complete len:468 (+) Transcript_30192:103-1506(+)
METELADGAHIVALPGRGRGVVATKALPSGTCLFTEYPIVAMQHGVNERAGAWVCERCFRFLGPLEAQVEGLLRHREVCMNLPKQLPLVDGMHELPPAVPCRGGCSARYCSEECAARNFADYHRLLCPGVCGSAGGDAAPSPMPPAPPPVLVSGVVSTDVSSTDQVGAGISTLELGVKIGECAGAASSSAMPATNSFDDLPTQPLERFVAHAKATNEIFLLAAKAAALVLCRFEADGMAGYQAAMSNFNEPVWWEAVATPDDATDEVAFRRTLRELLIESWTLLCALLGPHAPAGCSLLTSPAEYASIVGSFERRNCAVQVASPVEAYFLAVDAMPEGDVKASTTAVTAPLLDALDVAYSTPFEGTGIFPLQAMLNHSCEPNVTLLKEEGAEERDGRVVARLTRAVAEGEELCNAYVDTNLPVRRRRRELREYGFECDCPRCVRELEAANEKKAAKQSKAEGKRRLK